MQFASINLEWHELIKFQVDFIQMLQKNDFAPNLDFRIAGFIIKSSQYCSIMIVNSIKHKSKNLVFQFLTTQNYKSKSKIYCVKYHCRCGNVVVKSLALLYAHALINSHAPHKRYISLTHGIIACSSGGESWCRPINSHPCAPLWAGAAIMTRIVLDC